MSTSNDRVQISGVTIDRHLDHVLVRMDMPGTGSALMTPYAARLIARALLVTAEDADEVEAEIPETIHVPSVRIEEER